MVDWPTDLAPWINDVAPGTAQEFMYFVGVTEIVAGILVALKPRYAAYVVAAWLGGIVVNLLSYSGSTTSPCATSGSCSPRSSSPGLPPSTTPRCDGSVAANPPPAGALELSGSAQAAPEDGGEHRRVAQARLSSREDEGDRVLTRPPPDLRETVALGAQLPHKAGRLTVIAAVKVISPRPFPEGIGTRPVPRW